MEENDLKINGETSSEPTLKEKLQDAPKVGGQNDQSDTITNGDLPTLEEAQPIQKAVEEQKEERPKTRRTGSGIGVGKAGRGVFKAISCSIQNCACFGCLSIILLIVLVILVVYFRPPFLLNPLKKYVNQGYQPQTYAAGSVVDINSKIANELTESGEAVVTEQDLQTLMEDKADMKNISIDIEPSSIKVVTDVDSDSTVPLYVLIEISHTSDDKLKITKLGFQRYGAPKFVRDALTDSAFKLLDASTTGDGNEGAQFINSFVNQDNEDDIAGIRFEKDQIVIFLNE